MQSNTDSSSLEIVTVCIEDDLPRCEPLKLVTNSQGKFRKNKNNNQLPNKTKK